MIDRIANLLVVLVAIFVVLTGGLSGVDAWSTTNPWEEEWQQIPGNSSPISSKDLLSSMKKATKVGDYSAASTLQKYLESNYVQTGNVLVRLTPEELMKVALRTVTVLFLLLVPIGLNYGRHSRLRLWNPQSPKSAAAASAE